MTIDGLHDNPVISAQAVRIPEQWQSTFRTLSRFWPSRTPEAFAREPVLAECPRQV